MENIIIFFKKYLVLILCGALVLAALGAGIWYLTNPPVNDQNDASQETGDFDDNLNIDMGIGIPGEENDSADTPNGEGSSDNVTVITPDNQSGIVNVPGGDSASGSVTPVTPEDESNSSDAKPDNSDTPSDNENSDSNSGNEEPPSDPGDENSPTTSTEDQSQPVDMVGGVVDNPFN